MNKNICIVGLGLIGGSLGMAIKKKTSCRVFGLTRDKEKGAVAVKMKAVDYASTNIKGLIQETDIIFICYPISLIVPEIQKIIQFVRPGTIITDVASTKEEIVKVAEKLMPKGVFFVGGHPMAGKEMSGLESAEADLFKGKTYVLTKTPKTNDKAIAELKSFISKLGATVKVMEPSLHDNVVAQISHMPLAVAASLVSSVADAGKTSDDMVELAASGFRDTTRIASGDPTLGTGMFTTNKKAVLASIASFKKALAKLEVLIKRGDEYAISSKLEEIKAFRDSMFK
jgi:prephenate dehydrogenase